MPPFVRRPWARRIVVYLGCCFLFLFIAAPALPGDGPSQAQRKVIVGVPQSFPPYYQLDKDGNPSGFAVDAKDFVVSSEYRKVHGAWFGKPDPYWTSTRVAWIMGGGIAILFLFMAWWRDRSIVRLNRALKKSEARFKDLYDNAPDMYGSVDAETAKVIQCNQTLATKLGFSKDEIIGRPIFDLYHPDYREKAEDGFRKFIETGQLERDMQLLRKDGGKIDVSLHASAVRDKNGKILHSRSIWRDITDRKRAELAVKLSEARLAGILDIAPEAVITIDSDMNIQLFNQGAERIFGYKADEVLGRPVEIFMPESFREGHRKHVQGFDDSVDAYRLMDQRLEIVGLRKDGTEFPAAASVSKLQIGDEKIFTVMLRDITDTKQAQEALMVAMNEAQTASHAKSEFLAAMSHDLRTPLNAIIGFADILSHQYFGPIDDKYKEYAGDIKSSGEHLLSLVNDILDLSTIEAGKQSLIKEKLSTMEIVRECERIVEDKARSNGIDLVTEVPKGLPPLYADKRAAKRIILNLLSNAIKFTPEGGKVTVSVKASKKNTTLKVTDTGKGIPADELQGLTDPFTRADTDDPYLSEHGWGLGLTITKSLIDLHDGTLDIKSKVGRGTTVTVTLPNEA